MKSDKCGVMFQNGVCCCGCGRRVGSTSRHALTAEFIRDLLSSDGQRRPGDENLTGLAEALRPLDKELRMDVAAALYTYAAERLDAAENAETRALYLSPDEFRTRNLITAERLARLWREASFDQAVPWRGMKGTGTANTARVTPTEWPRDPSVSP